jgi:hypothetical protein
VNAARDFLRYLPLALRALRFGLARPAARVRLWLMDESRFGLRTGLRRRITLRGIAPVGRFQHPRACFWLYGAADALSGEATFRSFMQLNAANFQTFLGDIVADYPDDVHLMLVDNSRTHLAKRLTVPPTMQLHFLPPYSPELNPIERLWQHLKAPLAGVLAHDLLDLQDRLAPLIDALDPATVRSLICPTWLRAAAGKAGLTAPDPFCP